MGDQLKEKAGTQEVLAMSVYGWWFEQFLSKQGLEMVDNGNGRTAPATKVVFDENGGALNILNAWKELYDGGYAPNVGRSGSDNRHHRLHLRQGGHDAGLHRLPEAGAPGYRRLL